MTDADLSYGFAPCVAQRTRRRPRWPIDPAKRARWGRLAGLVVALVLAGCAPLAGGMGAIAGVCGALLLGLTLVWSACTEKGATKYPKPPINYPYKGDTEPATPPPETATKAPPPATAKAPPPTTIKAPPETAPTKDTCENGSWYRSCADGKILRECCVGKCNFRTKPFVECGQGTCVHGDDKTKCP